MDTGRQATVFSTLFYGNCGLKDDRFVVRKPDNGKYCAIFKLRDVRLVSLGTKAEAEVEAAIELFKAKGTKARVRDKSV